MLTTNAFLFPAFFNCYYYYYYYHQLHPVAPPLLRIKVEDQ